MACYSLRNVWLIGRPTKDLVGPELPTVGKILQHFFHELYIEKKSGTNSRKSTAEKIIKIWKNRNNSMVRKDWVLHKLNVLLNDYEKLKKNKRRRCQRQIAREKKFKESLSQQWNIAPTQENVITVNIPDGEMEFLRPEVPIKADLPSTLSTDSNLESDQGGSDESFKMPSTSQEATEKAVVVSPQVSATFDRVKLSNRKAAFVIASVPSSHAATSYSTIRRSRIKNRSEEAAQIKDNFDPSGPLVLHFDGKLLPDTTGVNIKSIIDRIAILVSGFKLEKLLGVPKISSGSGEAMATEAYKLLQEWGLLEKIAGSCFDTTISNTGIHKGACTLLQVKLNRDLLFFACRHHISEILIGDVFKALFGSSKSPDVPLFKEFQARWPSIDQSKYIKPDVLDDDSKFVKDLKNDVLIFAEHLLGNVKQPRDDYKEFLELVLLFLGKKPKKFTFKAPGAHHHARWMSKIIYALKVYLFRDQMQLDSEIVTSLKQFNHFICVIYVKVWFTSPLAADAPVNDLHLAKTLCEYQNVNKQIAVTAFDALQRHTWYLSEELAILSLFSSLITVEEKTKIVASLGKKSEPGPKIKKKKVNEEIFTLDTIKSLNLCNLVNSNSIETLRKLQINTRFLFIPTDLWEEDEAYQEGLKTVRALKVVNDAAERGIALIKDFNEIITKDENQKQALLQTVEKHRRDFPTADKKNLKRIRKE